MQVVDMRRKNRYGVSVKLSFRCRAVFEKGTQNNKRKDKIQGRLAVGGRVSADKLILSERVWGCRMAYQNTPPRGVCGLFIVSLA